MLVTSTLRKNNGGRRAAPEQYLCDALPDEASSTEPGGTSPGSRSDAVLIASRLGVVKFVSEHARALVTEYVGPFTDERSDADEIVLLVQEQRHPLDQPLRRHGLTPREHEVLWWVTEGKTNPEIGIILGRSARTVQIHLNRVYRKLGVETRTAAAALALRASLVADPDL